jgi:hypothetical protein
MENTVLVFKIKVFRLSLVMSWKAEKCSEKAEDSERRKCNIPGEKQNARLAGSPLATGGAVLAPKPLEDREDFWTKVNVTETYL